MQNPEDSFKTPSMTKLVNPNLENVLSLNSNLAYMITAIMIFSRQDRLSHRFLFFIEPEIKEKNNE